jgi:hypothetical protein
MTSLHRTQIAGDLSAMQALAAEFSGYAEKFRCFLEIRFLKTASNPQSARRFGLCVIFAG